MTAAALVKSPKSCGLTPLERDVLELESALWLRPGPKEAAIRDRLDLSPARYYQLLNRLIDTPAALAAYPTTVQRLRRLRDARRRVRSTRRTP